jgi:hypothetical protein
MLRINLLPPYIFDKQKKIKLGIVWIVAAVAAIMAFVFWSSSVQGKLDEKKKLLADATQLKSQYDDLDTQIKKVNDGIAVVKAKQTFIASAKKSNDAWPAVYEAMRDVTDKTILLQSLNVETQNHKALDFVGFAKDELTIARWWMSLRNATDRFDTVSLNLPTHPYIPPTASATGAGMGAAGMMGGGMGRPGIGMMSSSPGGMGMGMMSSSPGSMSGGGIGNLAGKFARAASGNSGGFGGAGGGARNSGATETEVEGKRGLNFTGTAMLKDTYAPPASPTWPPGGGGGGAGMGMMGGAGMGMMGGPGMGMMGGGGRMGAGAPPMSGGGAAATKGGKGGDE